MKTEITSHIKSLATACASQGIQVFIIGDRQQFHGTITHVDDGCVVLTEAVVAFNTGDLSKASAKIETFQSVPLGIIIVPMGAIGAIIPGKKNPTVR